MDFRELLLLNLPVLRKFAYKLTEDSEAANDLLQSTSLLILEHEEQFLPSTNFRAWAHTLMYNLFINRCRRERLTRVLIGSLEGIYFNSGKEPCADREGESDYIFKELRSLVGRLPLCLEQTFSLFIEGYSYQEIAELTMVPIGTVKSRIHTSRRLLRKWLKCINKVEFFNK